MKTTEFRCGKCDKLLAKFKGTWSFAEHHLTERRTFVFDEASQYLEIKCSRCKLVNKRELVNGEQEYCEKIRHDVVTNLPVTINDNEALEALSGDSNNADNV